MAEQSNPSDGKFWLHVPLQTAHSEWLTATGDGRLTVLGYPCQIREAPLPEVPNNMTGSPVAVRQYLLFDPLPEPEARKLLLEMVSRMPVLAFKEQASYEIPNHAWVEKRDDHGVHNLTYPALIASHLEPKLTGLSVLSSRTRQAVDFLGTKLASCPPVSDERILAAIDLANATKRESLARSIFLSWLTILDSLATRKDRPAAICDWLDEKIKEAKALKDHGLSSALGGLKQESHSAAIQNLICRAGAAMSENEEQVKERQDLAVKLYKTRSRLSHEGAEILAGGEVGEARELARFVVDAAIQHPHILDER
jgi:hypothetical protein